MKKLMIISLFGCSAVFFPVNAQDHPNTTATPPQENPGLMDQIKGYADRMSKAITSYTKGDSEVIISEQDIKNHLTEPEKQIFNQMQSEQKALVVKVANTFANRQNENRPSTSDNRTDTSLNQSRPEPTAK